MAAVAHTSPADFRRLVLIRTSPALRPVPAIRPGTVYRRRRAVAVVVVVTAGAALVLAFQGLVAAFGAGSVAGAPQSPPPAALYVVQPGDTLWDIARRLHPGEDPRPFVARMVAAHGSPVLVTGERLPLSAA